MAILFPLKIQEMKIQNSRFLLAQVASQRAKMLIKGAKPLVETSFKKPITIALQEIYEGQVSCYKPEEAAEIRAELEKRVRDQEAAEMKTIKAKDVAQAKKEEEKEKEKDT